MLNLEVLEAKTGKEVNANELMRQIYARIGCELVNAFSELDDENYELLEKALSSNERIYTTIVTLISVLDELEGHKGSIAF